ncbi:alkaline phosphatase family protein [candidate division CSSED10-310 bacterium]|uniref:Alkaline phosphatase family protein n=1 Tax=candidate division CSSED10-310 bacterium TaxID=2855610 RepID=A0ABV6Z115_UNCC1
MNKIRLSRTIWGLALGSLALIYPDVAAAYVGPGAGFAFVSTFFVFLATFFLVILTLLLWPLRFIYRLVTGKLRSATETIDRLIIIGFDGMEPTLADKWMKEDKLPNLAKLAADGTFSTLRTTYPAISPVAWSTFSTGVNPGKHNIYDFLSRNVKTYLPDLSSAHIGSSARTITIGPYQIPLGKPEIRLMRKSKPFWIILGEHGFFSHILRVPITFPPEKFNGLSLSAMCVPDLVGSQGSFTYYTSEPASKRHTGGVRISIELKDNVVNANLFGPENTLSTKEDRMVIPFSLQIKPDGSGADLQLPDEKIPLQIGKYTDWINVTFKPALWFKVHGICRFLLKEVTPHVKLYVTPINIDPEKPALPISNPLIYSVYLAKMLGPYATLGLAEDTWALNERIIADEDFLEQCYKYHHEREEMFMNALDRTQKGVCACVFDTTDRIQHMFFRYMEPDHPALRGQDRERFKDEIEDLYKKCDQLVGKVLDKLGPNDVLIIMSDHGFKPFSRGINLNSWLKKNGYLALKNGAKDTSGEWFENVDWSKTKAYNLGLGGLYLNIKGREAQGIVSTADVSALKTELISKLNGLTDPEKGKVSITKVYDTAQIYHGPYVHNAPDLIIGYGDGYRASWDGVTGIIDDTIFEDNTRAWSGDHCVDPNNVPGVIFCNRALKQENPSIADIAPTALSLYKIDIPAYMDGKPLLDSDK